MCQFRTLKADEIECRIGTIKGDKDKPTGVSILLYKDARVDMTLLDEVVGTMNWQRHHEFKDGKLYCRVAIYDKDKQQWIEKEDVGVESNTEKEKGQASDSFKRACVNWGIGRELYTAPFIWINALHGENLKYTKFDILVIGYDDSRRINMLVIADNKGLIRYTYGHISENIVVQLIEDCSTIDQLNSTFLAFPSYKDNEKVIAACKQVKSKLSKQ